MTATSGAYGVEELLRAGVLQQEAARPGVERVEQVVVAVEGRHDHHVSEVLGDEVAGGLDAVHPRHLDVHQDDVGARRAGLLDGLEAVGRLGHDLDVVLDRQHHREPRAHHRVVVDEEHPQACRGGFGPHAPAPSG